MQDIESSLTHNSKTADTEPDWGGLDKTKLPRNAFADEGDPDKKSTWAYPHHWVKNGTLGKDGVYTSGDMYLHKGGLNAAWAAAQGARSSQKASQAVIDHLEAHRKALGLDKENKDNKKGGAQVEQKIITKDDFKLAYPDLFKTIWDEAFAAGSEDGKKAGISEGYVKGNADGSACERERIKGIKAHAIPGMEALIETLIADGQTTPEQAAGKILTAHKENLAKLNKGFVEDKTVGKVPGAIAPILGTELGSEELGFMALVDAHMQTKKVSRAKAISAVAKENPKAHEAWLATLKPGEKEDINV